MKRLLPLLSLSLLVVPVGVATGCNVAPEMQRCVDFQNRVLSYYDCQQPVTSVRVPGSINPMPSHRWYFGGYGGDELGAAAWGGSDVALRGHSYRAAGGVDATSAATAAAVANAPQPYVPELR